jgi:murein L,D-transpeptidase YcbB/YkuD
MRVTAEAQASDEIKLGLAILQYARAARGGRLSPSRISNLLDQRPRLLDPKTVLIEIAASLAPDGYLRSLHPKQEQFERAAPLLKARAEAQPLGRRRPMSATFDFSSSIWSAGGGCPRSALLRVGQHSEFVARVIKHGSTIYM